MKKVLKYAGLLTSILLLSSCSNSESSNKETAGNSKVDLKIVEGSYILPPDQSDDDHFLALKVNISNKSSEKLEISTEDLSLYDEDGEKISAESVYDTTGKFETMGFESISKGKNLTTYVVYEVDKDKNYELHFEPLLSKEKVGEIELKLDVSKYKDQTGEATKMAQSYIEQVFLNGDGSAKTSNVSHHGKETISTLSKKHGEDKKSDTEESAFTLGGDLDKDKEEFYKTFIDKMTKQFYSYKASEAEIRTFAEAYVQANGKRAKVSYRLKSYLPETLVVYVRPEVIDLSTVDEEAIKKKFIEENRDKFNGDYSDLSKSAEKFVLEQLPSYFDTASLSVSDYMSDKEGFELKCKKKDGKWVVDTSDYTYESLSEAFIAKFY